MVPRPLTSPTPAGFPWWRSGLENPSQQQNVDLADWFGVARY
jgi:hypothetical protein